jgi:zinc transporter, ZIP family
VGATLAVEMWEAFLWGGFSSASLYVGQWLAGPLQGAHRLTGQIMAFGAGTLLSAIAYELVPASTASHGAGIGISFALGAVVYFVADAIVARRGGSDRQEIASPEAAGSGAAMFIGALLDGIPEAFILGITLAVGGSVDVAFVAAVFVSNIPQGIAGTTSLKAAGSSDRGVFRLWTFLTLSSAVTAAAGYVLANSIHVEGIYSEGFAAGAVLMMLANSMMPEAFEHGGKTAGLLTVLGYLVAAALTAAG